MVKGIAWCEFTKQMETYHIQRIGGGNRLIYHDRLPNGEINNTWYDMRNILDIPKRPYHKEHSSMKQELLEFFYKNQYKYNY